MKKNNYFLSALLIPAIVLQAGPVTTPTCTGGTGGSVPTINLPAGTQITGSQGISGTMGTEYTFTASSSMPASVFTLGIPYAAYCSNTGAPIPSAATQTLYTAYNTYLLGSHTGGNFGSPGPTLMYVSGLYSLAGSYTYTSTVLQLADEWAAVNWLINNPHGVTGEVTPTAVDTQAVIWQLLNSPQLDYALGGSGTPAISSAAAWQLYQDAITYGTAALSASKMAFSPVSGQLVAVLLNPATNAQGLIVPFPIPCTSGTGSATLTKTSNVSSSGANAFQLVTYTYTVKNTGSTTLGNITIVDDNGTPNYPEDDYTVPVPAGTTIPPNSSYSISTTVYLPISLFYQSGNQSAFDTLIPQVVPVTTSGTSLQLTYLIDTDVTDNSYGSNSSGGWPKNGHTFAELEAGYAEFAFYNALGMTVSDFNVNYIKNLGSSALSNQPSDYGSTPGQIFTGGTSNISYLDSTLADNLNDSPQYYAATTNSPVAGSPNWIFTAGYKVLVSDAIFGMFNWSFSASVKKNYLAATETGFGGGQSVTYCPTIYGSSVTSTAYLCANVCGCSTVVHAKACLTVKMCGSPQPTCNNPGAHICQNPVHCSCTCSQCTAGNHGSCTASKKCTPPVCSCTCAQCKVGNHASCSKVGCTDPTCHANNCNHNTVQCTIASKPVTYCW